MKKYIFLVLGIIILILIVGWAGMFYWRNLRGAGPAFQAPKGNIAELIPGSENAAENGNKIGENTTDMPLTLPSGFSISIFAENLPGARVSLFDSFGNMWVSRTGAGVVTMLEIQDGKVFRQDDVFRNLNNPHGLALDPENPGVLYFAEENKISRMTLYSDDKPQKIADLPESGGHFTRTLIFGADGRLYVSVGSSCNVCDERDTRRAKIFSMNKDGSDFKEAAAGLRNAVFMANHPASGKIWLTEMGRDLLGDNIPPDEINILENGKNYGWPYCYGKNIHDNNFDSRSSVSCGDKIPSLIDIPAHSAPLGLAFVPENSNWPEKYKNNLLVAFHGSWNRSVPTGYKIARYELDRNGNFLNNGREDEDFITGWLRGNEALGRPVDLVFYGNDLYVSDDKAGVIYKVNY